MAAVPGSMALKAAAVASVLAMLVMPSLGRCGHSRAPPPPPPAPTPPPPQSLPPTPTPAPPPSPTLTPPAPAPAPGPVAAIFCPHCFSDCFNQCDATTVSNCSGTCDPIDHRCSSCRTTAIQECKDSRNCTGTCDECNNAPEGSCTSACDPHDCDLCMVLLRRKCSEECSSECSPPRCTRECPPPQCILVTFSPPPPSPAPPPPPASAPTPPPPAPLPPTPAPAIPCKDCSSQCLKACAASIASNCSDECNGNNASCISCRSTAIQSCRDFRNCTGSCDECNGAAGACNDKACSTRNCSPCTEFYRRQCEDDCKIQCSPPTCID